MIRVLRVRYIREAWVSHLVDKKFNNVELAKEYYKDYYSVKKLLLDYEEC